MTWPMRRVPFDETSIEFVKSQSEARHKRVQKVAYLGEVKLFDTGSERLLSFREFLISRADLFQALQVSTELVRCLDELARFLIRFFFSEKESVIIRFQNFRESC